MHDIYYNIAVFFVKDIYLNQKYEAKSAEDLIITYLPTMCRERCRKNVIDVGILIYCECL